MQSFLLLPLLLLSINLSSAEDSILSEDDRFVPVDADGEPIGAMGEVGDFPNDDYLFITGRKFYWPAPYVGAKMEVCW